MDINDMASGESLVTSPQLFEVATLQEIHIFGAQALRKKRPNSQQVVTFSAGRSKRIQASRVWHVDGDVSNPSPTYRGYARSKRKREHVIEDSYTDPYLFRASQRRSLCH
ncbi:hypothetical protein RHMOL_Rhmol07G0087300 [Rhododendron molle]|uniref:Uncharacterized protein n=1 Tax=Rhododendron molle TaxID=49168 RepID=A0ACC0MYJ6_RHOML|nr:hypothetical protein RHMOL_Rhmol07G0087300 [Rhododendron molle]